MLAELRVGGGGGGADGRRRGIGSEDAMTVGGYLAATVDAFRERHGMDASQLADWLGCAAVDLQGIRNQVRPHPASPTFEADVQRVARLNRCRADRLRALLIEASEDAPASCAYPGCPREAWLPCKDCREVFCSAHAQSDWIFPRCSQCAQVFEISRRELFRRSVHRTRKYLLAMALGGLLDIASIVALRENQILSIATLAIGSIVASVSAVVAYRAACESAYRGLQKQRPAGGA
jgi:hypothetical protein